MIERGGVNVFDINNLPSSIQNSKFSYIVEFTTRSKRLANLIVSAVQNRQVYNSFSKRVYFRD